MNAKGPVNPELLKLTHLILVTTPGYVRMRHHPELQGWAANLVAFCERDELRPLEQPVKKIVSLFAEGSSSLGPFFGSLAAGASAIHRQTLLYACQLSAEIRKDRPYASFMLVWVALCAWVIAADISGENLYVESGPARQPNEGWIHLPAACIAASLELQGLYGSSLLAEEAYAVLQTNVRRRRHNIRALGPTISGYRHLARRLADRYQMAIAGLADDLREACRTGGRARKLVAALLWAMGLVPEGLAVSKSVDPPGVALLRRLIRFSFQVLPTDPLIQYLWLEMKEVPELDLQAHGALYIVLNHRWDQFMDDEHYMMFGLEAEPSRLCARTLESLLAGDLDKERASGFLRSYEVMTVCSHLWGVRSAYFMPRLDMLRYHVDKRLSNFRPDFTEQEEVEWLREVVKRAAQGGMLASMFPDLPDLGMRTGIAVHETIELLLREESELPNPKRCMLAIESLESYRTGALSYWLNVIPPLAPADPNERMEQLLAEELEILERIRGTYFLILRQTLPHHTLWMDMDLSDLAELKDPERHKSFFSADVARKEMNALNTLLTGLFDRMSTEAPSYAEIRRRPSADLASLVSMLAQHRRP